MFGNAHYSMLFTGCLEFDQTYPLILNYSVKSDGEVQERSEDFNSFEALEWFVLKQRRISDFFQVLTLPNSANFDDIVNNRALISAYFEAAEEEVEPQVAASTTTNKRKKPAKKTIPDKLPYKPFDDSVPEGEKAKLLFMATEFKTLEANFRAVTQGDPFFPANRKITILDLWGAPGSKTTRIVNEKFWFFALKEFEAHQRARILRGEEKSNCWKEGASAGWHKCDRESLLINQVVEPPKGDFYKPALGPN